MKKIITLISITLLFALSLNAQKGKGRLEKIKAFKSDKNLENLSETDAKELVLLKLNTDKKLYESQKVFINKMEGILSAKKIIKLQVAEMEFGRKLMRKYKFRGPNPNKE